MSDLTEKPRDDVLLPFIIIVNTRPKKANGPKITYEQVVALAFSTPVTGPNIQYSVVFSKGPSTNPQGSMSEGQSVDIQSGMSFDVTATDKS